jgi:hypothetical protein
MEGKDFGSDAESSRTEFQATIPVYRQTVDSEQRSLGASREQIFKAMKGYMK